MKLNVNVLPVALVTALLVFFLPTFASAQIQTEDYTFSDSSFRTRTQAAPRELVLELWHSSQSRTSAQELTVGDWREDPRVRYVWLEPAGLTVAAVFATWPLIPGDGRNNDVSPADLASALGLQQLEDVTADVVAQRTALFFRNNAPQFGIDPDQMGEPIATQANGDLWHVSIPQVVSGVDVRFSRLSASISHGNLIAFGTDRWQDVSVSSQPLVEAGIAVDIILGTLEYLHDASILGEPQLVFRLVENEDWGSAIGVGFDHRLVWEILVQLPGQAGAFRASVDAHNGDVLALVDTNHYHDTGEPHFHLTEPGTIKDPSVFEPSVPEPVVGHVIGSVYPAGSTEVCNSPGMEPESCGEAQPGWPMPYADVEGDLVSSSFADSAGMFEHSLLWSAYPVSAFQVTTELQGRYVTVTDDPIPASDTYDTSGACGPLSETQLSSIDLGGDNGHHYCDVPSSAMSSGNTAGARTAYYALNRIIDNGRGWIPSLAWIEENIQTGINMHPFGPLGMVLTLCNAFYSEYSESILFMAGGSYPGTTWHCREAAENAPVAYHEWGHSLDDHDAAPGMSNSAEGYADLTALFHARNSCIAEGFYGPSSAAPCGVSSDGLGALTDSGTFVSGAPVVCALECTGFRELDHDLLETFAGGASVPAATPENWACEVCPTSSYDGPCGGQAHCEGQILGQMGWDFVNEFLPAMYDYNEDTAYMVANRLHYQGSTNVSNWYSCDCNGGLLSNDLVSHGCTTTSGLWQWLVADDDDGDLSNRTPHWDAIMAAFEEHEIGCPQFDDLTNPSEPRVCNSIGASMDIAPDIAYTFADDPADEIGLVWSAPDIYADEFWIMRSEGVGGCEDNKIRIDTIVNHIDPSARPWPILYSYRDDEVLPGRRYCYTVVSAYSDACHSKANDCRCVVAE